MNKMDNTHQRYFLPNGQEVPSVTTILSVLAKPELIHWAWSLGKEGRDYQLESQRAADIGTLTHYYIERYVQALPWDDAYVENFDPGQINEAQRCFRSFIEWSESHDIVWQYSEKQMISNRYAYGGTIDILADVDDIPTLIDIKTSKSIYPEYSYQLSAYEQLALENNLPVKDVIILRLGRAKGEYEIQHVTNRDECFRVFMACHTIYNARNKNGKNNS